MLSNECIELIAIRKNKNKMKNQKASITLFLIFLIAINSIHSLESIKSTVESHYKNNVKNLNSNSKSQKNTMTKNSTNKLGKLNFGKKSLVESAHSLKSLTENTSERKPKYVDSLNPIKKEESVNKLNYNAVIDNDYFKQLKNNNYDTNILPPTFLERLKEEKDKGNLSYPLKHFNKFGITIVLPHKETDHTTKNFNHKQFMANGCQFIAMNFQEEISNGMFSSKKK
jgi:hypothetical protein